MTQVTLARGWDLEVERGPDWLFVRPQCSGSAADAPPLADEVWALLEKSLTHRLVLELDDIDLLTSHLIGQLMWLRKRIHSHDGMMRLCGLSAYNAAVLEQCHLSGYLPHYHDREEAVMGHSRPKQPR